MESIPHADGPSRASFLTEEPGPRAEPRKLILCFDGTGNEFSGSNADTNVVKILNKLDRNDPNQFHYYQTGIGTYGVGETSVNKSWLEEMQSSISKTVDQAVGTTFDAHVLAGYQFLMRYYDPGDKIYLFGFSRGAYTAKFLARMINTVGLLCKGNAEMAPFAFRLYQRYLAGQTKEFCKDQGVNNAEDTLRSFEDDERKPLSAPSLEGRDGDEKQHSEEYYVAQDEIIAFSNTFCRSEESSHCGKVIKGNIKVYFLGMWDCVNSVAVLERKAPVPVPVKGTAQFVRHAVSVDERRVKFKPALLAQDIRAPSGHEHEDIKEVWFPGGHGDVGGGWPARENNPLDTNDLGNMTWWQRMQNFWRTRRPEKPSEDARKDPFQMSDLALAWMISEVEHVGQQDPAAAVKWSQDHVERFKQRFKKSKEQAMSSSIHDSLNFSSGTGFFTVLLWKFMEWLPFVTRWELEKNAWVNVRFPLNGGDPRDIPRDAVLHESILWRLQNDPTYLPKNNHGGKQAPCLKNQDGVTKTRPVAQEKGTEHQTYMFPSAV